VKTVHAIFENGVFRPKEAVDLPEHTEVEFEPRTVVGAPDSDAALDRIYEILSETYDSGQHDVAARHNEHQP
jgi:predicted DNA-binding antitoxin AbrB/MazE fold protein